MPEIVSASTVIFTLQDTYESTESEKKRIQFNGSFALLHGLRTLLAPGCCLDSIVDMLVCTLKWVRESRFLWVKQRLSLRSKSAKKLVSLLRQAKQQREKQYRDILDYWCKNELNNRKNAQSKLHHSGFLPSKIKIANYVTLFIPQHRKEMAVQKLYWSRRKAFNKRFGDWHAQMKAVIQERKRIAALSLSPEWGDWGACIPPSHELEALRHKRMALLLSAPSFDFRPCPQIVKELRSVVSSLPPDPLQGAISDNEEDELIKISSTGSISKMIKSNVENVNNGLPSTAVERPPTHKSKRMIRCDTPQKSEGNHRHHLKGQNTTSPHSIRSNEASSPGLSSEDESDSHLPKLGMSSHNMHEEEGSLIHVNSLGKSLLESLPITQSRPGTACQAIPNDIRPTSPPILQTRHERQRTTNLNRQSDNSLNKRINTNPLINNNHAFPSLPRPSTSVNIRPTTSHQRNVYSN